jgi:hypothetical protein
VVDEEGKPVPGATVEVHALPLGVPFLAPLLHASAKAGADGTFRVGPGPSPWWSQGMLSAHAPGYARYSLRSRAHTFEGAECAEEGADSRLVLSPGIPATVELRAKDGGGPDGPVTVWTVGPRGFFDVQVADAKGGLSFVAPPGPITITALEGVHPAAVANVSVVAGAKNHFEVPLVRGRDVRGKVVDATTGRPVAGAVVRGYWGETRLLRTGPDGGFLLPRFWFRAFQVRAPGFAVRTHQLPEDAGSPGVSEETVRLEPGFVARGRLTDLDGRPLAGARLRILTSDPAGDRSISAGPYTRADGAFVFVGLPLPSPGREVRVFANAPDCAWGASPPLPGTAGGIVDGVELRLPRLVDLEGRVEDEAGAPLEANVRVDWDVPKELKPYADVVPSEGRVRAREDGRFRLRLPERVPYRIFAEGGQFGEAKVEGTTPAASEERRTVVVKANRGLSIRGSLVDAEGNPVRWGEVRVEPRPPTDPRPSRDARVRPDGTFEAGGLVAGAYDFSALAHPEFLQEVVRDVQAGGPEVKVVLRRPGGLRFKAVLPEGTPEGTVPEVTLRALESTLPLTPDHFVRLLAHDPRAEIGPLAPAAYTLSVVAGDHRIDIDRLVIKQGEPTDLGDLALRPAGVVAGRVTHGGVPVAGAALEILCLLPDGTSRTVRRVKSGGDGAYRAGGLLACPHVLLVRATDRPTVEVRFQPVTGAVTTLDVPMAAGARLRVVVRDAAGQPVAGARLAVQGPAGGVPFWKEGSPAPGPHETGPDGTLRCTGLPAGALRVLAEKPGAGSGETEIRAADGASTDVEIRFGK